MECYNKDEEAHSGDDEKQYEGEEEEGHYGETVVEKEEDYIVWIISEEETHMQTRSPAQRVMEETGAQASKRGALHYFCSPSKPSCRTY